MKNKNNGQSAAKYVDLSIFKPIPNYEDRYLINSNGDVWSLLTNKILKPSPNINDGYLTVSLSSSNGKSYSHKIHRLVATTWLDNPNNLPEVNHKDFDRINNYVSNLEWVTHYDNIKYTRDAGRYDCIYNQTRKAYVFTNVHNGKSFTIIGYKNLCKALRLPTGNNSVIHRNANTGKYIARGVLKGLKIDIVDLQVRRPTAINGVGSSDSETVDIPKYRDEDMASSEVKVSAV